MVEKTLNLAKFVLARKNSSSLYNNFILNLYIVDELYNWSPNCKIYNVKLIRNSIKCNVIYNGRRTEFDGEG